MQGFLAWFMECLSLTSDSVQITGWWWMYRLKTIVIWKSPHYLFRGLAPRVYNTEMQNTSKKRSFSDAETKNIRSSKEQRRSAWQPENWLLTFGFFDKKSSKRTVCDQFQHCSEKISIFISLNCLPLNQCFWYLNKNTDNTHYWPEE